MTELVDRVVAPDRVAALAAEAAALPAITLDARELADLTLIATGAATPLTGFLGEADYRAVLAGERLADGRPWPLPFVLAVADADRAAVVAAGAAALLDATGRLRAVVRVSDVFRRDPIEEARAVFGTDDANHPGVAAVLARPRWLVGGAIDALPPDDDVATPRAIRAAITARGWRRVAGFVTGAPIHRADEHRSKVALDGHDGLVLLTLAGDAPGDEVPAAVRRRLHETLVAGWYPADRTILAALPAAHRHAGAREQALYALLRENFGITSLLYGRDLAGAGAFYCRACEAHATARTCPHGADARLDLSGARIREVLRTGGELAPELVRPALAAILRDHYLAEVHAAVPRLPRARAAVDPARRGFVLWFTGLSGAGKSTLSAALARRLAGERRLEVLDGDEVRTHLSKGLGFSKADRDVNVHRIAFVARTLARHGVGVVTAAISPYADTRRAVRELAEAQGIPFVEVYARAELAALVDRDPKGLYKKALAGEVRHFTGVSDQYEPPEAPDVVVRTDLETVDQSVDTIVAALAARGLVTDEPALRVAS